MGTLTFYSFLTDAGCSVRKASVQHIVGQQESAFFKDVQEHGCGVGLLCAVHVLPRHQNLGTQQVVQCLHHRLSQAGGLLLVTEKHITTSNTNSTVGTVTKKNLK